MEMAQEVILFTEGHLMTKTFLESTQAQECFQWLIVAETQTQVNFLLL